MHPLINIAIKAARNASKIILRATDRLNTIQVSEKNHNEFVTDIDLQAEQEIIKTIHESYPEHAILGEESGASGKDEHTWIIDPIDGTTNFINGNPHFCISIGIKYKDRIEHGLIYDPLRQEMFTATNGEGAFLNERRIRVSEKKQLSGSIIAIGFSNKNAMSIGSYLKMLAAIMPQSARVRLTGSAALDLAYVACGRLAGSWGIKFSPWDIAAGTLLITEAGGVVTDLDGNNDYMTNGNVISGNQIISKALLQVTKEKIK